ncbi:3'-5' exonuclease [Shewanella sp. AS1]|uniref:exonuclease domain-containing protein n=1 Tax=Shewanella sp. AS1 TaxID=2907626 RepID=UPI001F1C6AB7|nr:exonuclease domain-containing protein [Shewanella sp. AS1]MCE9679631.1 3'-5' exonuclease [Shewanella sp. AS1]
MLKLSLLKSRLCWRAFRAEHKQLKSYQRALLSELDKSIYEASLVALDLEMTGLNSSQDQILSIGLIPIERGQIILQRAEHRLVQIRGSVGNSAVIHGILDAHLTQGETLDAVIAWLLQVTEGKILVAHHAPLDLKFIQQALLATLGETTKFIGLDTLAIEKKRLLRQHEMLEKGSLRLGASRQRYNLPVYAAHNAIIDALACGELLLAQVADMGGAERVKVCDLLE